MALCGVFGGGKMKERRLGQQAKNGGGAMQGFALLKVPTFGCAACRNSKAKRQLLWAYRCSCFCLACKPKDALLWPFSCLRSLRHRGTYTHPCLPVALAPTPSTPFSLLM